MDQQVLRPILYILLRCRRACVSADPPEDVIGKALVELRKFFGTTNPSLPTYRPSLIVKGWNVSS
jgi:hypothetical protein